MITDQGDDFVDTIAHKWSATSKAYRLAVQAFSDASLRGPLTKLMDDTGVVMSEFHWWKRVFHLTAIAVDRDVIFSAPLPDYYAAWRRSATSPRFVPPRRRLVSGQSRLMTMRRLLSAGNDHTRSMS